MNRTASTAATPAVEPASASGRPPVVEPANASGRPPVVEPASASEPSRDPTRLRTLAAGLLLALTAALVLTAAPAYAVDGRLVGAQPTDDGAVITLDVPEAAVDPDLDAIAVTIDGAPYDATATRISDGVDVDRTAVLAIDTSQSMSGERFAAAQQAARSFLDLSPADVAVGIVTFDSDVTTALDPTTDRDAALAVVDDLTLSRETLLYQGVIQAVDLADDADQGTVLVLSDGADTSTTPLADVVGVIQRSGVLVDVVALDQATTALPTLQALAGPTGQVLSADSDALAGIFSDEASGLDRQVQVAVTVSPAVVADAFTAEVTVPTAAEDLTARATFPGFATTAPPDDDLGTVPSAGSSNGLPRWVGYAGTAAVGLGLLVALLMLVPRRAVTMSAEDRVAAYTLGAYAATSPVGPDPVKARPEPDAALKQATAALAGVLERNRSLDERIAKRLEAAGSQLKPSEWLLAHLAIFVGVTIVGLLLSGFNIAAGLVFMLLGAVLPWVYLGLKGSRRRRKFESSLPETLQLMSGSLSAGLSLMQSVDTIVREGGEPVASAFRRVLVETRIGVTIEDALDGVAERFGSKDFRWVVMAIRIQRQVGGNLAELLDTVAATIREREYVRRQVGALAAEGKLSAIVIGALPPGFALYLLVANPDYLAPLFSDIRGQFILAAAATWLAIGAFWMSKLIKVEV